MVSFPINIILKMIYSRCKDNENYLINNIIRDKMYNRYATISHGIP